MRKPPPQVMKDTLAARRRNSCGSGGTVWAMPKHMPMTDTSRKDHIIRQFYALTGCIAFHPQDRRYASVEDSLWAVDARWDQLHFYRRHKQKNDTLICQLFDAHGCKAIAPGDPRYAMIGADLKAIRQRWRVIHGAGDMGE